MAQFECIEPFWIDTDGYTDRDREMFVCGAEFMLILARLREDLLPALGPMPIHRENESRLRLLCGRNGLKCTITPHKGYEGCETWSDFKAYE